MSNLLTELDVDVVKLTLTARTGSGTTTVYLSTEYWAADALYSGSPIIYPNLVEAPTIRRSLGNDLGIRHDVTINIYGKSALTNFTTSFLDLLEVYEIANATAEFLYFAKPWDGNAVHSGDESKRQSGTIISHGYDDNSGVLTLVSRDTWFEDRRITAELSGDVFPNMDENWDGEVGPLIFGEPTVAEGIIANTPVVDSGLTGGSAPYADYFVSWAFGVHVPPSTYKYWARNQFKNIDKSEWIDVDLGGDSTTPVVGDATFTADADPPNHARDLSRFARSITYQPSSLGQVLTTVRAQMSHNPFDRCADMSTSMMFKPENQSVLSRGNADFTFEVWLYFDAVSHATDERFILGQGPRSAFEAEEWTLYFAPSNNAIKFDLSFDGGGSYKTVTWSAGLSTGTWYQVICWYTKDSGIGIAVNAGTAVTTSTTSGDAPSRLDAAFCIGDTNTIGQSFDGRVRNFKYWSRVLTSGERTTLYNSGAGLLVPDLSDDIKKGLVICWPLNEPYFQRLPSVGSTPLIEHGAAIPYAFSSSVPTINNKHGQAELTIWQVESTDSGNSYVHIGNYIRRSTIDISDSDIVAGTSNVYFQIDPLVLSPNVLYAFELNWTNDTTNVHFVRCAYRSAGGAVSYALDKRVENAGWAKQTDIELALALYCLGDATSVTSAIPANPYSVRAVRVLAKAITLQGDQQHQSFYEGFDLKIGRTGGLVDDGSGTYTGGAGAVIKTPADIVCFVLLHSAFLGISSAKVDTSAFATIRALQAAASIYPQVRLDRPATFRDFIAELCRHGRMIFYKSRVGKLTANYPVPSGGAVSYAFTESRHRAEAQLISVQDEQDSNVINDFFQLYAPDELNVTKDATFLRRARSDKFNGLRYINTADSTDSDTYREGLCATSVALYGKREHRATLDMFDSVAPARSIQNYLCDRHTKRQQVFIFRVPKRLWYNLIDVLTSTGLSHSGLRATGGTGFAVKSQLSTGEKVVAYNEGVPSVSWNGGEIKGEVVGVTEQGPWMTLECQTVSSFSSL